MAASISARHLRKPHFLDHHAIAAQADDQRRGGDPGRFEPLPQLLTERLGVGGHERLVVAPARRRVRYAPCRGSDVAATR